MTLKTLGFVKFVNFATESGDCDKSLSFRTKMSLFQHLTQSHDLLFYIFVMSVVLQHTRAHIRMLKGV